MPAGETGNEDVVPEEQLRFVEQPPSAHFVVGKREQDLVGGAALPSLRGRARALDFTADAGRGTNTSAMR
jgi:hypothetical protein